MSYKGWFRPKNPIKYKGDAANIVYRSSWELRVMKHLDINPNVLWWASEELTLLLLKMIRYGLLNMPSSIYLKCQGLFQLKP